jgi:hypothetical protein
MRRIQPLLVLLASIAFAVAGGIRESAAAELSPEIREAEAWLDTLGLPDVKALPFVRVSSGSYTSGGNAGQKVPIYTFGFLQKDDGKQFSILMEELLPVPAMPPEWFPFSVQTFNKNGLGVGEAKIGYEILDLRTAAALLEGKMRPYSGGPLGLRDEWRHIQIYTEFFLFARACGLHGQTDLSDELLGQAAAVVEARASTRGKSLHALLEADISRMKMWQATCAFSDLKVSRPQILAEFEDVARLFPDSEYAAEALRNVTLLRQMIAEDEAHDPKPLEKMTPREQAEEWIFRLRDQNGHQMMQPGWCDIFATNTSQTSPAEQLLSLGAAAVPALIAALGDKRFTRCVTWDRNFTFSHEVLRVGDCARSILDGLAGRRLSSTGLFLNSPSSIAAAREAARRWWSAAAASGEQGRLVVPTTRGDRDSPVRAR